MSPAAAADAIERYGIDPETADPRTRLKAPVRVAIDRPGG